jgi:hypothetical protein
MDGRGQGAEQASPLTLWQAPVARHGEVSLIVRPLTEEEERVNRAVGGGQGLEEEDPGSEQVRHRYGREF